MTAGAKQPSMRQMQQWTAAAQRAVQRQQVRPISIAVMDAEAIAALNHRFRNRKGPTNVLSFPAPRTAQAQAKNLGDIALCGEIIAEESRSRQVQPLTHWAHLVIHATFHLMGYDHQTPGQAAQMEALESRVMGELGLEDPWQAEKPILCEGDMNNRAVRQYSDESETS